MKDLKMETVTVIDLETQNYLDLVKEIVMDFEKD